MVRKTLGIGLIVLAVAVLGVTVVYAQNGGDGTTPPGFVPPCWGAQGVAGGAPMMTTLADALGLDLNTLWTELQSGKSVAEIAEAQNVALEDVIGAVTAAQDAWLDEAVEAGWLTEAQAEAMRALHAANVEAHFTSAMPMFGGAGMMGFGYGHMHGGYGPGMMGFGYGHMHGGYGPGMMGFGTTPRQGYGPGMMGRGWGY
ncbi:MAG: hypothetical protein Kow0077_32500 [Anaerolineae bacterium]